jgi:hypothetical protein
MILKLGDHYVSDFIETDTDARWLDKNTVWI